MTLKKIILVSLLLLMAAIANPVLSGSYYNVSNTPFATISSGPQNAIVVDVSDPANSAEVQVAVAGALGRTTRAADRTFTRQIAKLREAGLIRPDVDPAIYANILVRSNGVSRSTRAYGGGEITFTYTGWSTTDEATLRSFEQIAYPIVKEVYGDPARTITVNVFNDTTQSEKDSLLGGAYVTGSDVQPQIRLWRYASNVSLERSFLHMMVRAFHDMAAFDYDAWEEGFCRAATVASGELVDKEIARNPSSGLVQMDFVGRTLGGDAFYYLMSNYETLNQPPLSNNTFFTSWADTLQGGGLFAGLIIPRLGMSSTAWMKVYIERLLIDGQSFFKLFNDEYYEQLSGNPEIAGNVPALKSMAAGITSTVEGSAFDDWFTRQYIFDSSISIGKKLYAFVFPPDTPTNPGTEGYSIPTFLMYYVTTSTGDETPLAGTVYPVYWDYQYVNDIFLSGQYESVTIEMGEGYVDPTFFVDNIGGAQRSAMDFTIGTETVRIFFPAGMTGSTASPNNFIGVVVGTDTGSITAKVDSEATGTTTSVTRGAFGESISLLDFHKLTIVYTPTSGSPVTRVANVGPGAYGAIVYATSAGKSLTHIFTSGTKMISIPMTTFEQDQARGLAGGDGNPAIAEDKLLLARWNPLLTADYKYEMYPRTPPFTPDKGYWIKFPSTVTVTVAGMTPDPTGSYRIGLVNGWNQIGCPFEESVAIDDLLVEKANDEPVAFSTAWSTGIIGKVIWKYIPGVGYEQATSLDPWEGYWVKCNITDGAVLIVPGPDSRGRAALVGAGGRSASDSPNDWSMKFSAVSPSGDTSSIMLGVAAGATDGFDNAFDAEIPPAYGSGVMLAAKPPSGAGEACAVDTRAEGRQKVSWDVMVTPSGANQDIVIKWGDITKAPKRYKLTLLDQATGRSQYIRTTSSYRLNSGDGSPRRLTVIADSSPSARLMITNMIVGPTRGSSMSFSYNLSTDAQITAEIVGASGRCVRLIDEGRVTRSGINTLAWDGRDNDGRAAPAGVYILQISAVTEEGEMTKGIRPVLVAG